MQDKENQTHKEKKAHQQQILESSGDVVYLPNRHIENN